jgi:ribosomal protein S18 acetylase RimI-like enzyme
MDNPPPTAGSWVRFDWNLERLAAPIAFPAGYVQGAALLRDRNTVLTTVLKAYASDPVWQPQLTSIQARMQRRLDETIGRAGSTYLIVRNRENIVAVSGVARDHWTDQNFLTGICVLPDHQRLGVGRALLLASLYTLREMRCATARVYTEHNSLADRKIYPLFGSTRTSDVHYPGEQLRLETGG